MKMRVGGAKCATWFCAAMLLCGAVPAAGAKSFKAWPIPFDGTNGVYPAAPLYLGQDGVLYGTTEGNGTTAGTVFGVTQGGKLNLLYAFKAAPDGAAPEGGVAVENDGTIFGSTYNGGPESLNYPGTIYKISPKGKESIPYYFCQQTNCADGQNPNSTLVADNRKSGYVYGTTHAGGNGFGTLFRMTTDGQMQPGFYTFCQQANCTDGSYPIGAPWVVYQGGDDPDVVFGVTTEGGANGIGVLYLAEDKLYNVLYSFDSTLGIPQGGVIQDRKSNSYGVATGGKGFGVVYKISIGGKAKPLYSFNGGTDGDSPIGELVMDGDGNLYGVTAAGGDNGVGTVYEVTPKGVKTILHSFDYATDGADPQAGLSGVFTKSGITLYGTTTTGGAYGDGAVFKLVP